MRSGFVSVVLVLLFVAVPFGQMFSEELEPLENPEFSKWRYLMDMGSPTAMPGVDPAASPDAPWLQNLYNAGTGQAQGLMGQLTGSQQLSRVLSSLDDTSDDYYNI